MKHILLIISLSAICFNLLAQSTIENIVSDVEKNNTTLLALRKSVDAQKVGNKTGIYLQNPEISYSYLWGNPSNIGNREDFSITQSFDFPTAYGYKSKIARLKNEQTELEYLKQLKTILLKTKALCFDLIYSNALHAELSKRLIHAQNIANSYKLKFDKGDANILEFNKAQLNLLMVSKELEIVEFERKAQLAELSLLNGGTSIDFTVSVFPSPTLTADFEQWYTVAEQNNPTLSWLKKEIDINRKQIGLSKAMNLPKLEAGYISESVVGQNFRGISVGLSIPLWENKNKVKYAKANALAIESIAADNKLQFYNQLRSLHAKTIALQKSVVDYRSSLLAYSNEELLKKALNAGEISMIEYIIELSYYYEDISKLLKLECEMNKSVAELEQYE